VFLAKILSFLVKLGMNTDVFTQLAAPDVPSTAMGRLTGAGYIHRKTGTLDWRVLGRYALVYVLEGRGRFADAGGSVQAVEAGDLLLLFPELAHRYGPGDTGTWAEMHILFEGPAFDLARAGGALDSVQPVCRLEPVGHWQNRLEEAARAEGMVAVTKLLAILVEAAAMRGSGTDLARLPWLEAARRLLETDLNRDLSASEVATKLGLSYETFRKAFEQQTGVSPARYRAEKRMDAARALLLHTPMTGRQIADSLGYPDEFYFSRRFKQVSGVSPREFRRRQEPGGR